MLRVCHYKCVPNVVAMVFLFLEAMEIYFYRRFTIEKVWAHGKFRFTEMKKKKKRTRNFRSVENKQTFPSDVSHLHGLSYGILL